MTSPLCYAVTDGITGLYYQFTQSAFIIGLHSNTLVQKYSSQEVKILTIF